MAAMAIGDTATTTLGTGAMVVTGAGAVTGEQDGTADGTAVIIPTTPIIPITLIIPTILITVITIGNMDILREGEAIITIIISPKILPGAPTRLR